MFRQLRLMLTLRVQKPHRQIALHLLILYVILSFGILNDYDYNINNVNLLVYFNPVSYLVIKKNHTIITASIQVAS